MWTTSNSRAEVLRLGLVCAVLYGGACATAAPAPDSPRPARDTRALAQPGPTRPQVTDRPVELAAVRLRPIAGDTLFTRLARPELRATPGAVAIDVTTAEPLGNVERTASLEIYLDDVLVGNTWPLPPNRLVAFLPNAERLRPGMAVSVAWLGDEARTRSTRPIVLTEEHLRGIR